MVSLPTAMTCARRRLSEPERRLPTRARIRALMAVQIPASPSGPLVPARMTGPARR